MGKPSKSKLYTVQNNFVAVYRNLNKAKGDKSKHVWSVADSDESARKGKLREHTTDITILNPRAIVKPGALKRIQDKGVREVAAWIGGIQVTTYRQWAEVDLQLEAMYPNPFELKTGRPITINPLPKDKGGRAELAFTYYGRIGGKLHIRPCGLDNVDFDDLAAIRFTSKGAYGIFREIPRHKLEENIRAYMAFDKIFDGCANTDTKGN